MTINRDNDPNVKLAKSLSNGDIAVMLLPITAEATQKAEQTHDLKDKIVAFALAAAGLRLAELADAPGQEVAFTPRTAADIAADISKFN